MCHIGRKRLVYVSHLRGLITNLIAIAPRENSFDFSSLVDPPSQPGSNGICRNSATAIASSTLPVPRISRETVRRCTPTISANSWTVSPRIRRRRSTSRPNSAGVLNAPTRSPPARTTRKSRARLTPRSDAGALTRSLGLRRSRRASSFAGTPFWLAVATHESNRTCESFGMSDRIGGPSRDHGRHL